MKLELSNNEIEILDLKKKHVSNALKIATINGSKINNEVFLSIIEYQLVKFNFFNIFKRTRLNNLSYSDGKKVRDKIKQILIKENIWQESKQEDIPKFSNEEIKQFNNQKAKTYESIKNGSYIKNGRR